MAVGGPRVRVVEGWEGIGGEVAWAEVEEGIEEGDGG